MLMKHYPFFSRHSYKIADCPTWVIVFKPLFKCFVRIAALFQKYDSRKVVFWNHRIAANLVSPKCAFCGCSSDKQQQHNQCLFHLVFSFAVVLFLNINSFAVCAANSCDLYNDDEYADCASSTTGWAQYQCGGGSGSCSDVCGGCGWRPKTAAYLNANRAELDNICKLELGCDEAKCSGVKTINQLVIGRCGVGYQTASALQDSTEPLFLLHQV